MTDNFMSVQSAELGSREAIRHSLPSSPPYWLATSPHTLGDPGRGGTGDIGSWLRGDNAALHWPLPSRFAHSFPYEKKRRDREITLRRKVEGDEKYETKTRT